MNTNPMMWLTAMTGFVAMCWVMTWEWLTSNGPRLTPARDGRGVPSILG